MRTSTMYKLIPGLLLALLCTPMSQAQTITTVAGSAVSGFSGDGAAATNAGLANVSGVAVDANGNIYIADKGNNRIRKVTAATGNISTICGTGAGGYVANGLAISTPVFMPDGVFLDNNGNLHITQWYNDAVQKMNVSFSGPAADAAMLHSECGNGQQGGDGDGGPGDQCRMEIPSSSWVDAAGNLYVADFGNGKVRMLDAVTHIVSTIATPGCNPNAICVDASGNIYIAGNNNKILMLNPATGSTSVFAGTGTAGFAGDGGSALTAQLNDPGGMFIDNGNMYVADMNNNRIRKINMSTGIITTVAGNGTLGFGGDGALATNAMLNHPTSVWVANGILYIADDGNHRVRKVVNTNNTHRVTDNTRMTHTFSGGLAPKHNPANIENVTMSADAISIFPNPSTGIFTLAAGSNYTNANVEVYNAIGDLVYTTVIDASQNTVDLRNQASGMYFINVISATDTYTQRVILSK